MNRTADACNATYKLLQDGHVKRDDLADLTVNQVREICTRAQANVDRVVKTGLVPQKCRIPISFTLPPFQTREGFSRLEHIRNRQNRKGIPKGREK